MACNKRTYYMAAVLTLLCAIEVGVFPVLSFTMGLAPVDNNSRAHSTWPWVFGHEMDEQ